MSPPVEGTGRRPWLESVFGRGERGATVFGSGGIPTFDAYQPFYY